MTRRDAARGHAAWQPADASDGGLAVAPPRIDLQPGQRSTGLRVLDLEEDGDEWLLTIEGTAGHGYEVDLFGTAVTGGGDRRERPTGLARGRR